MITFLTLFLGLVLGERPVAVQVAPEVAAVELYLDGEEVARMDGPPWRATVDFGPGLSPHLLEAVAYDGEGRELDRARQGVNLPRDPAEVTLFLETLEDGRTRARLSWQSVVGTRPERVRMELDGEPLPADLTGAVLPPVDPDALHLLRAELTFPRGITASTERVFGGGYQESIESRLTAVPVSLERGGTPEVGELRGAFRKGGEILRVVAVEEGVSEVIFIPDAGALEAMRHLFLDWLDDSRALDRFRTGAESLSSRQKRVLPLPEELRVRFLWPYPKRQAGRDHQTFSVFETSPPLTGQEGGMFWLLTRTRIPGGLPDHTRLAEAVAAAGHLAAARNRRRLLVLLWTGGEGDVSRLLPVTVRRYLEDLRVPLEVWDLGPVPAEEGAEGGAGDRLEAYEEDLRSREGTARDWGERIEARTLRALDLAITDLYRRLDRQRIVWFEGVHLPQHIRLADRATDPDPTAAAGRLRLARTPVPEGLPVPPPPEPPETGAGGGGPRQWSVAELSDDVDRLLSQVEGPSVYEVGRGRALRPPGGAEDAESGPEEGVLGIAGEMLQGARERVTLPAGTRLLAAPDPGAPPLAVVDAAVEVAVVEERGPAAPAGEPPAAGAAGFPRWARVTWAGRSGWVQRSAGGEVQPVPSPEGAGPGEERVGDTEGADVAEIRRLRLARARRILGEAEASLGPWRLHTDLESPRLLERLDRLAGSLARTWRERYGVEAEPPGEEERILLFARPSDYRRFQLAEGAGSGLPVTLSGTEDLNLTELDWAGHTGGGLAALPVGEREWEELAPLVVHELAHLISHRTLGTPLPPWLEEGLAEDLSYGRILEDGELRVEELGGGVSSREQERRMAGGLVHLEQEREISGARAGLLRLARAAEEGELTSLEELTHLSWGRFVQPAGRQLRYAQAGFFVRFLLGQGKLARGFRAYLEGVAAGEGADRQTLLGHLGEDWTGLERRFRAWLRRQLRSASPAAGSTSPG